MAHAQIVATGPIDPMAADVLKPFGRIIVAEDTTDKSLQSLPGSAVALVVRGVVPHPSLFDLHKQDQEFVDAVREQRDPAITGEAILPALRVLQAAQACAQGAVASFHSAY